MSTHKYINHICVAAILLSLLLTFIFMNGRALGIETTDPVIGYENRLFDTSRVHTVDIVMDNWSSFLETCENEEYSVCSVVIDGESYKNVGIRAKGNTSLSSVSSMGSDRYSFKIEFDQYDSTKSYYGLDKLSLNNLIQDSTCMKDYLVYQLRGQFGVDAPLCSYVYITVNGQDWGLYLAVEGVEDSFLQRNYGSDTGELYKPDSTGFGGGRGNGNDFDMDAFQAQADGAAENAPSDGLERIPGQAQGGGRAEMPEAFDPGAMQPEQAKGGPESGSSSDIKLQYIDDDPDSYANIFDNAKTEVSNADRERLIASLKALSSYENLENVLDTEEVLRYFVVHNFVVNGDSYTGTIIHNYYLHEKDGKLSMIPWDYNLAFGTFSGGEASASVNDAIDDVLSDRPMQAWIFSDSAYMQRYHDLFAEFLNTVDPQTWIENAYALIAPYVEKDPTKFCTYEEFEAGVQALQTFCQLRRQSVEGQLDGTIPSTSEAQRADSGSLIDSSGLNLSAMGSMSGGMGGKGGNWDRGDSQQFSFPDGAAPGRGGGQKPDAMAPQEDTAVSSWPAKNMPSMTESVPGDSASPTGDPASGSGTFAPSSAPTGTAVSLGPSLLLLVVSLLCLAGGLLLALRFKT